MHSVLPYEGNVQVNLTIFLKHCCIISGVKLSWTRVQLFLKYEYCKRDLLTLCCLRKIAQVLFQYLMSSLWYFKRITRKRALQKYSFMGDMKGIWIVKLTVNQGFWDNSTNAFIINFTNMFLQIKEASFLFYNRISVQFFIHRSKRFLILFKNPYTVKKETST